ncbi:DNA polymerase III subunit delta [Candidatus Cyanaurora vandensis]|uniref:DNA polymerase III subunit delta n=1 Tax=Candidatus Cyanaurora vandensis TaxID=2714958 RepID=UPI00257C0346|nr:DNA polymerase III subunit delta [Candidatus Cyanaurora vandensis]
MPVYLYWGEDRFLVVQQVQQLRRRVETAWQAFNDQRFSEDQIQNALNESLTPPFGSGDRVIWIESQRLFQQKEEEPDKKSKKELDPLTQELARTLPLIPVTNHLIFTAALKPNGKHPAVKLLQKHAQVQEFALIPAWKEDELIRRVQTLARAQDLKLSPEAVQYLVEALGNDTARLHNELAKLALYPSPVPLRGEEVRQLVVSSAQTSFQLAEAILQGKTALALTVLGQLFRQNEPALKVCAVLTTQFRVWVWVKLLIERGTDDPVQIAEEAQIGNPKRVYFLKKQVQGLKSSQLLACLPVLLALEESLKQGQDPQHRFPQTLAQLCACCASAEVR